MNNMATGRITNITSYDVLADPALDGVVGEYQLDNYTKNVGNNRLKVFLGLHQHDYDRWCRQGNTMACDSIVTNVLYTLNKKCVPTGRFLINSVTANNMAQVQSSQTLQSQSPVWKLMSEYEAKHLIHGILKGVNPPDSYLYWQQQQLQQQHGAIDSNQDGSNGMEEHKRRRRSSLLRRSASDSLLDDSKKVFKFDQELNMQNRRMSKEEPTWSSSRRLMNNRIMALNRMDVILTSTMDALDPNCLSIGNNRLHILVAMQSGKYQQANDRQRESILDEVMQTVNSFWKGRFLTESMSGCYEELDSRDAKRSLRHIFDMRSRQSVLSQASKPAMNITPKVSSRGKMMSAELVGGGNRNGNQEFGGMDNASKNGNQMRNDPLNMMRNASTSALMSGNNTFISNDTKKILSRQMSSSLIPNQTPNPSLPRMEPPIALSGLNDLRSAAIKSLQKQKARQEVANRLEKVSMRNSQQQLQQLQQQLQQPNNINMMDGSNMNNHNFNASFPGSGIAKRRQSSIFGALDPTVMDEIVDGCFDDED